MIADYSSPVFFWSAIELSLTVISACLPTLAPIFKRYKQASSSKPSDFTASSGQSSSFGRNRYIRSVSADDGFELPVLNDVDYPTHIQANGGSDRQVSLSADDGIVVKKEFSSTSTGGTMV